jgi:hypothetical protein
MAKYNLIINGSLESLTISGTGNKSLNWSQLESLMDGTTTSGGVSLTSGDVLYLEAGLSNRIKVDGVRLYVNGASTNDVKFYYKNSAAESYTTLTTQSGSEYFYITIPDPSAPMYVRTSISGITGELYEFQIFNDDYIVGFGSDGSLSVKYLENTPIGEEGDSISVAIFNNSTNPIPADAYCCIDYTGTDADNYIKISSSVNGTYYGIKDGAIIEDNKDNFAYRWDMGEHSNTTVSGDNVILIDPTTSGGVYTSPIFSLDNKYMTSYFITDGTTESGTSSISYNENVYNGTIRVRSSNIEPLCVDEVFLPYSTSVTYIARFIVYNGNEEVPWKSIDDSYSSPASFSVAMNRRNGDVVISYLHSSSYGKIRKYNKNGIELYECFSHSQEYKFDVNMECDKFGGIWGYGISTMSLIHWDNELDQYGIFYNGNDGTDFLYDLAVEMDGDGIWYTNKIDNYLFHKNYEGTTLNTIVLNEPRAICGTLDNGCWVIDNTDKKAYRYNFIGARIKTVNLERTATRMCTDMVDGFWYISGNYIYHVNNNGVEDISVGISQPTKIKGGYNGCIVWSSANDWVKYIDNNGNITRTFTDPSAAGKTGIPALFSFRHEDFKTFRDTMNIIPVSYDPVWGTGGSLEWKEVKKDGYFLPKTQYHQSEITLRCEGVTGPTLNKLVISPAIKIQDISKQSSKNVYVKTIIPDGALIEDYETKLKAWWGVNA